jgi:hypothetical protein
MTAPVIIPLSPVATQVATVQLSGQRTRLEVFQKRPGMFLNLFVNDAPILYGAPCRDRVFIVRDAYLGFIGDLAFEDVVNLEAPLDPYYTGLGTRFLLTYWPPS